MAVFEVVLHEKFTDLKELLDSDPACVNAVGWHGMTPLHHALIKNNQDIIDLLLKNGAKINQPNAFGETPIHFACQASSLRFVNRLLEIGANLRAVDNAGKSCIHHAARGGSILKLHFLIASGLSLKNRDNRGQTALHVAAEYGHIAVCEYLLREKRFSPDVRDSSDMAPLHLAAKFGQCEVAWALESKSTHSMIFERDATGKTPLDYASDGDTPRHIWLKQHLKYWQSSRCPPSQPPRPWMPWLLLLLSPSFGILLVVLVFNQLSTPFAWIATLGIIVFFNVWSFTKHRLQHISALPNPGLAGFFFGLIIQSVLCYFLYIVPQIWPEFFWTSLAALLLLASLITLKKLLSDPGITKSDRVSEFGEKMTIFDVAKGVLSEDDFCTTCEIVMPELTKHCRLCEVCVVCMDHHCVFLNGCIAKNNHRAFVIFMLQVMLANLLFVRAASHYFDNQVFLGESSSFSEAMGKNIYVSVLFIINIFGAIYVFLLTFFQFKIITDGGTTFYSSEGNPLHRTWQELRYFGNVTWSNRIKLFVKFLLGEYSFYKTMQGIHAQRLV